MNTRLTVADVRPQLYTLVDSSNINSPKFLPMLNEACERYFNSGKWKGMIVEVEFDSSPGYVTLPYEFLAVLATQYDRVPVLSYSQFHPYLINGPGDFDHAEKKWRGILEDMGDGYPTQLEMPVTGTLRIKTHPDDNDKTIRLFGLNQNNEIIYDDDGVEGVAYTTQAPYVDTTEQFSQVLGIQSCPDPTLLMEKSWTLHVNDGNDTKIGSYYPGENRPMYRRYKVGQHDKRIRMICQRRFILMRNESDWVIPGNISALREGFWALNYLDGSDNDKAELAFNRGLNWLNSEAKSTRGGNVNETSFINWGAMGGCGGSYGMGGMVTV